MSANTALESDVNASAIAAVFDTWPHGLLPALVECNDHGDGRIRVSFSGSISRQLAEQSGTLPEVGGDALLPVKSTHSAIALPCLESLICPAEPGVRLTLEPCALPGVGDEVFITRRGGKILYGRYDCRVVTTDGA